MSIEWFIARKIFFSPHQNFSRYIVKIATVAVALSVGVMIISTSLIQGFQEEISGKVYGFFGQIQISKFTYTPSIDEQSITPSHEFISTLQNANEIKHVQSYAYKPAILKTDEDIEGIILKGIAKDFDATFLQAKMLSGSLIQYRSSSVENEILLSENTAQNLQLKVGDKVAIHIMQNPPHVSLVRISGIYRTGLEEFDKLYAVIDIRHIQRWNQWNSNEIAGLEIFVNQKDKIRDIADAISYEHLPPDWAAQSIMEIHPNIFDWLQLQDMNEFIIMLLMIIVAAINMITCLLIIILERTTMIGVLKALGAYHVTIRKIFVYSALYIVGRGLFWGNLLSLGLLFLQKKFKWIQLNEKAYYVSYAPVKIDWNSIVIINASTFFICFMVLIFSSFLISKISPVKVLRFE